MVSLLIILFTYLVVDVTGCDQLVSLPISVTSRINAKNFNRDSTISFSFLNFTNIDDRKNLQPELIELLASRTASFISYASEFTSIIGTCPQLTLIEQRCPNLPFAHEGGAYIPETNEVWFTANQLPVQNTNISSINLLTNQVQLVDIYPPIVTPNGVNYFEGYAYVCSQGNKTTPGGIYAVNPTTRISRLVVNSWFGFRLNSPNDVTFSSKIAGRKFMWFTDPQVAFMQGFSTSPQFRSTVFRFDLLTSELRPVITDLIIPNGIAFNLAETVLYITDTSSDDNIRMVYAYDLTDDGFPINRRIFSIGSLGIPDGIRVDLNDRVWIAEGDGLNVRDQHGTLLGVILGRNLCANGVISNFALVKNTIILLAQESLWRLNISTNLL